MKLLFDENVSPKLVRLLAKEYPGSTHVRDLGLRGAPDSQIWDHACENGFVIVSKDDDFRQRSLLYGAPPKLIWLQVGNAGASPIADLLREHTSLLRRFEREDESAVLILSMVRRAV